MEPYICRTGAVLTLQNPFLPSIVIVPASMCKIFVTSLFFAALLFCGTAPAQETATGSDAAYLAESHIAENPQQAIDMAITGLEEALVDGDTLSQIKLHLIAGKSSRLLGDYQQSLSHLYEAMRLADTKQAFLLKANALSALARAFADQGALERTYEVLQEALAITREEGIPTQEAIALNELGNYHYELAQYKKALEYFSQAMEIRERLGDESQLAGSYNNVGVMYKKLGRYPEALEYTRKSQELFEKLGSNSAISLVLQNMGELYEISGDIKAAEEHYLRSLELARQHGLKKYIAEGYQYLSKLYKRTGEYKKALDCQDKYLLYRDSLYDDEIAARIAEMDRQLELKKQEVEYQRAMASQDIALLQKENEIQRTQLEARTIIQIASLVIFMLISVAAWALYRKHRFTKMVNRLLKEEKTKVQHQNRELHHINAQLNISQEELRNLNATKDKLFSIISHDLKSPLNSLLGFIDVLKQDFKTFNHDEVTHFALQMERSVESVQMLLNNLLQWSANQSGKLRFQPEKIDMNKVLEENCQLAMEQARAKGIRIATEIGVGELFADYNMLSLVVRNLLNNAIKFTPFGGTVTLVTEHRGKGLRLSVIDTGIGMTQQEVDRLFHEGSHFSSQGTNREKGFGLGLLLTKEFVSRHSGEISIESEQGKGTAFHVYFPQSVNKSAEVVYS